MGVVLELKGIYIVAISPSTGGLGEKDTRGP